MSAAESPAMVPVLVRESILRNGARTAVVRSEGPPLSYSELGLELDVHADALTGAGVRPNDVVLYCGERGLPHLLTLLASWQLGAAVACVLPQVERDIEAMRRSVRPRVVVTDTSEIPGADIVGGSGPAAKSVRPHPNPSKPGPHDLAYLLPTSGTTGMPKVVAIPHRALERRYTGGERIWPLSPDDVVLASSSPTFDFSLWETTAPLAAGATIAFAPPHAEAEPSALNGFITEHGVNVAHFVPTLLAHFIDSCGGSALSGLRLLFIGGERLTGALCRKVREVTAASVWNQYGPTEACIDVLHHAVRDGDIDAESVPIGDPIDCTTILVLDSDGQALQGDGIGQVAIGGPQLAWGYVGLPGRTASAFVPAPQGPAGSRLYLTGDLVSRRGRVLTYAGRTDNQVKVRGVRLEPAAIEGVIVSHPAVGDAAVVAVLEGDEYRLVAHIVPQGSWSEPDLRRHIADNLPLAAMPGHIIARTSLPRLATGKVDRNALVSEGLHGASPDSAHGEAGTGIEALVREVWAEVLGVPVAPSSSFSGLGGTSLTAMQVVARMRRATGVKLPVRMLFTSPTLEEYAAAVDSMIARSG